MYSTVRAGGAGRYTVTFWVSVDNLGENDFYARAIIRGSSGNSFIEYDNGNYLAIIGRRYVAKDNYGGRVWYKLSGTFDVTASDIASLSGTFNLMLDQLPVHDNQVIYIDDVCLYKTHNYLASVGKYFIRNKYSGKYLSISSDNYVVQKDFDINSTPYWRLVSNGNNVYTIFYDNTSSALTPVSSQVTSSQLCVSASTSSLLQTFRLRINGDGISYKIIPNTLGSNYYGVQLPVNSSPFDNGVKVKVGSSAGNARGNINETDCWYFEPADGYSPSSAVVYATLNYDNYDVATYADLRGTGGDCANFVSQALAYGGKTTNGTWYSKKNGSNRVPTTTQTLNDNWAVSASWMHAESFRQY